MSCIFAKHFSSSSSLPVRVPVCRAGTGRRTQTGVLLTLLYNFSILKLKIIYPIIDFLEWTHNFKRTNQGYRLKGKIPYQKFLNGKRKYSLPEPR